MLILSESPIGANPNLRIGVTTVLILIYVIVHVVEIYYSKTKRLCDFEWFARDPIYKRIYDIIALEGRLPSPCDISVIMDDLSSQVKQTVLGFALKETNTVWFRYLPPAYSDFAHELIHLAVKRLELNEEVYAYNLSTFVVFLAESNVIPRTNPLRLFEDLGLRDLAGVICEVTGVCEKDPRGTIREYFRLSGVIPIIMDMVVTPEGDLRFDFRPNLSDKDITIETISEILSAVEFDSTARGIAYKLLDRLEANS